MRDILDYFLTIQWLEVVLATPWPPPCHPPHVNGGRVEEDAGAEQGAGWQGPQALPAPVAYAPPLSAMSFIKAPHLGSFQDTVWRALASGALCVTTANFLSNRQCFYIFEKEIERPKTLLVRNFRKAYVA